MKSARLHKVLAAAASLFFLSIFISFPLEISAQQSTLRAGFAAPPASAKLRCYWWWLNGNTDEAAITRDLTEMHRKGFGGVLLVDANGSDQWGAREIPAGPTFGSPAWMKLYLHALQVASSMHIEVTLNAMSGWNLGGPDVTPAQASKLLTWSRVTVTEKGFDGTLPMPEIKNGFYSQIAVLAYPLAHGAPLAGDPGSNRAAIQILRQKIVAREVGAYSMPRTEPLLLDHPATPGEEDTHLRDVQNITNNVDASGHLDWKPPTPGVWEILRIGYTDSDARVSTSSGKWQGLAIDYLDRGAFDTYWQHTLVPILKASQPYLHTTLISLATDSWELGGTNWTGRFADEFRKRRGYDPIAYLPIVAGRIVDNRERSNRFLDDLRRTVADLITDHYDHFAERAKTYGLGIQCESGGPHGAPIDALETFRSSAAPQTEYWAQSKEHRTTDADRYFTKEAASAADIYGKQFVAQEGMTSIGPQWSESLATDLKPSFDQGITEGMNRLVWHEFTSIPASAGLPGNEYFAGTHMNPNLTWWQQSGDFFLYLNRVQFMMQQGHAVDDVLYYYGDAAPNFVRLKKDDPAKVLPGYDYDVTDEDALLRTIKVRDGALETPTGNRYRVLVLPNSHRIGLKSLEWVDAAVRAGVSVVAPQPIGPVGILSAQDQQQFNMLVQKIWGSCSVPVHSYGAGKVFCGAATRDALTQLNIAQDFSETSGQLDYIHRSAGKSEEIYFIRNVSGESVDTLASFRVTGHTPELWNAVDGSITSQENYTEEGAVTKLPLHLAPYGSVFVVFSVGAVHHAMVAQNQKAPKVTEIPASTWKISYQPNRGAPSGEFPLTSYSSWTDSPDAGVKYFSGTAVYRAEITADHVPGQRVLLKLADLHEICTVKVNGKAAGTIWAMPYQLDITSELMPGKNKLELSVTNLWPNRIIGDAQPGVTQRYTSTNISKYKSDSPLLPSGLTGPVSIAIAEAR